MARERRSPSISSRLMMSDDSSTTRHNIERMFRPGFWCAEGSGEWRAEQMAIGRSRGADRLCPVV